MSDTLCGASDDYTAGICYRLGPDKFFKIYLYAGESVSVQLNKETACVGASWTHRFAAFFSTDCSTSVCSASNSKGCGAGTGSTHTAASDGWYTVLVGLGPSCL